MLKERDMDKAVLSMDKNTIKKISVSAKRQMTIPKQYYDELQLENEVTC